MYTVLEDGSRGVCGSTAAGAHGARPGLISAFCVFPWPWRDRSALNRQVRAVKTKTVFFSSSQSTLTQTPWSACLASVCSTARAARPTESSLRSLQIHFNFR